MTPIFFKVLIVFFSVTLTIPSISSDLLRPLIFKQVQALAKSKIIYGQFIGVEGSPSAQYKRFEKLKKGANKKELILLTSSDNPIIRCYAFWALADRKAKGLPQILFEHIQDSAKVHKQFGCVGSITTVADFYIDLMTEKYLFTADYYRKNHSSLKKKDKSMLDSLVLYSPVRIGYLSKVLIHLGPDPKYYDRIKSLAKSGYLHAFPALSKYNNPEDLDLIIALKNYQNFEDNGFGNTSEEILLKSIELFPDPYFMDFIHEYEASIADSEESYGSLNYYSAIAAYQNEEAADILLNHIISGKKVSEYQLQYISLAVGKYPTELYIDIMTKLWRVFSIISENSFNYLKEKNEYLTFELFEKYFQDFEQIYGGWNEEKNISIMLPFALKHDRERTIQIISKNLKTNSITPFHEFVPFAKKIKDTAFIPPLLYRIKNEWNTYVVYDAVRILASYKDKKLNDEIISTSRMNHQIIDQYNSREDVENLIQKIISKKGKY